jgi:aryl-alcohol dehydrogenase-like predicted oxidoreductase
LLGLTDELGITFVAYSPLSRGFLTGELKSPDDLAESDWRRQSPRFQGDNFQKNLELVEELKAMARDKGTTAAQLALAWILSRGKHVVPIPGMRRIERLEENAKAADITLTDNELHRLEVIAPVGAAAGKRYPEPMMAALNG